VHRVKEINDLAVHVSRSHSELVHLRRHVARVTRHILLVKAHLAIAGAQ